MEEIEPPRPGADPEGGGGGRAPPPALDHQFFFSTNFLTIAKKIKSLGIFYGRYVP